MTPDPEPKTRYHGQMFTGQGVDYDLARKLANEQAERDSENTRNEPGHIEAPLLPEGVPAEKPQMTQEEAMAQLPDELKAAMGKIMKYQGKWVVRLPDVMRKVDGKEVRSERFLSNNGEAMRVFHTKAQAEAGLQYYQSLVVARIALREDEEKKAEEAQFDAGNGPLPIRHSDGTPIEAEDPKNAKPEIALG